MAPGPLHTPHSSSWPMQSSTSSQMPSASASAVQSPLHTPMASGVPTQSSTSSQTPSASASMCSFHHTPRASSWLPLQSQSPTGMSSQPQSPVAPGPLTNAAFVQLTNAIVHRHHKCPSASASAVQSPLQTPMTSGVPTHVVHVAHRRRFRRRRHPRVQLPPHTPRASS